MKISKSFAIMVFDGAKSKQVLSDELYQKICVEHIDCALLTQDELQQYADALKDWAIFCGAKHFAHWFQPLTELTAEKHTSFLQPRDGKAIYEFDASQLFCGEGDASSFPNGGLRQTFEARGVTKLDTHSNPFVKDECLYIPTTFSTTNGYSLDKKMPLLNSCKALDKSARKLLEIIGMPTQKVTAYVGCEQEYFLIDRQQYLSRQDLVFCDRTVFGAEPVISQESSNHYYATITPNVAQFMQEVDDQLLKLGIVAKIEHNEVAPCQYELVTTHVPVDIACDQNQLVMEILTKCAQKHNFACILHEKPFSYVNGSGKHNNWSMSTAEGFNMLSSGETPLQNALFVTVLCAIIQAIDTYPELLRISVASLNNDYRLGQGEAPSPTMSMFIGDKLTQVFEDIVGGKFLLGRDSLALEGATDRNRTSPFAYTGNKFEFRSVGSSASIADANTVLNTIVAESLDILAEKLQNATDVWSELNKLVAETYTTHKRIVYNGNNYSNEWKQQATKRNLPNIQNTSQAIDLLTLPKHFELYQKHNVFCQEELVARQQIMQDMYSNKVKTEVSCAIKIAKQQILPWAVEYVLQLQKVSATQKLMDYAQNIVSNIEKDILTATATIEQMQQELSNSQCDCQKLLALLKTLRQHMDNLEQTLPQERWKMPTYTQMLYGAK